MIAQCSEPGCEVTFNGDAEGFPAPQGWHWELLHELPYHQTRLRRDKKEAEEEA